MTYWYDVQSGTEHRVTYRSRTGRIQAQCGLTANEEGAETYPEHEAFLEQCRVCFPLVTMMDLDEFEIGSIIPKEE